MDLFDDILNTLQRLSVLEVYIFRFILFFLVSTGKCCNIMQQYFCLLMPSDVNISKYVISLKSVQIR